MLKRTLILLACILTFSPGISQVHSASTDPSFTKLTQIDLGTFNEYRYRITEQYFDLKSKFEINGSIDRTVANNIYRLAKEGYNYLPDNLANKNLLSNLKTALERGVKYPENESNYGAIVQEIQAYLEKVQIQKISGKVEAFPKEGNAPLTVTLRGNVKDPSGTKIPGYNYVWWIDNAGKRTIIGKKPSITYTFREEGNFSVFLDVTSSHKNEKGFTDVLPFRSRADIKVKEKVASVIVKVNSVNLRQQEILKFTPEEAAFGLVFDATSSTPTSGTKFLRTQWDFGNGVERENEGGPEVERIKFLKEGEFTVTLKLKTNELKSVERKFTVAVHDPIATIHSSKEDGFLGDKFTFSANPTGNDKNLSYAWEIVDIDRDEVILRKNGNVFTYSFKKKGKYNLILKVTEPSGEVDIDTKIIYINSRAPVADFKSSIPFPNKPNTILLDGSQSFDPDFSDDGKLKYSWIINGDRVSLEDPNFNGSVGYYTFDSIGDHSVVLEVTDPENISAQKSSKIGVDSILAVEYFVFPRVTQRETNMRFIAQSPEARFYEWDFGDGTKEGGSDSQMIHKYEKSGVYNVKLKVVDKEDNHNSFSKNVYIGESDAPYAFVTLKNATNNDVPYREGACDGQGAYVVNRVDSVTFSGEESIDVNGQNSGLNFSWKLGADKFFSSSVFTQKFDEIGCFPLKLTVESQKNGRSSTDTIMVKVENVKPTLSSLDVSISDIETDPVVVNVNALGAKDEDGVIQSYLWYYYTDVDSEPQDFRATKSPSTTFVLPKITGNYYFVVVMKDNNEARISSEEITGSKYFITLAGDNINTPLVNLSVNDSSVAIGDEVIFTARVENILGQDISKKVEYSWDIDGDGFYEKKTNTPSIAYKFNGSGQFHSKVKAKFKGFSNTKSITMNVSNILKPDFSYISVGNTFSFLDTSVGSYDTIEWKLGDGTTVKNQKSFSHVYKDKNNSHFVELKITEGDKEKTQTKKVVKKPKNLIQARKGGLVLFSHPEIDRENNQIVVESKDDVVYIYLGASSGDIASYRLDYDLNYDSNLNGGKEDDSDNFGDESYNSGESVLIPLNDYKEQKLRASIVDENEEVIDSFDLTIIKNYIEEEQIDLSSLVFKGVTESEKLKIEKLKNYISDLEQQDKLKALMYVQKLQEEWFDNTEKTRVILEFESFIYDINPKNTEDIINTLESLLVEHLEDKSEKNVTFNALKNLIPLAIVCDVPQEYTGTQTTCHGYLVEKLEAIRDNTNTEENRELGKEILEVIAVDETMTNKQKTDFKEILKPFVYGGLDNVPEDIKSEVNNQEEDQKLSSSLLDVIKTIFFWIFIIIALFVGAIALYWLYYKVSNKNANIGFQDFIIEKTSGKKPTPISEDEQNQDILDSFTQLKKEEETKAEDPLASTTQKEEPKQEVVEEKTEEKVFEKKEEVIEKTDDEKVPDWLKGSMDTVPSEAEPEKKEAPKEVAEEKIEEKQEEKTFEKEEEVTQKVEDEKVPDWLKGSMDSAPSETQVETKQEVVEEKKKEEPKQEEKIPDWLQAGVSEENKTKKKEERKPSREDKPLETKEEKQEDVKVPDWLQAGAAKEEKTETKEEKNKEEKVDKKPRLEVKPATKAKQDNKKQKVEKKVESQENLDELTKLPEDTVPDWLKGSLPDMPDAGLEDVNGTESEQKEEVKKDEKQEEVITSTQEEKSSDDKPRRKRRRKKSPAKVQEQTKEEKTVPEKKEIVEPEKKEVKKEAQKEESKKASKKKTDKKGKQADELWDDGMTIPDWLKTDDDK